ncbi:MAG TPA: DUF2254 domain-containing protein [Gammaproteobacteria bacterium]|nr:DUF2254 domain-containing protein [Gammaproteobacteria bacterium]
MIGKTTWLLRRLFSQIWVRAVSFAGLGVVTALAGIFLGPLIPDALGTRSGAGSVDQILTILASSMLAVVTFSLSVAVQAFAAAANTATPRATKLLQEDGTTQNVLATFVGAFLFSLVGIIALNTGVYGEKGRVVLFAATIIVVALVVVALLRWIDHLMRFGRMGDTLDRVEKAATEALKVRARTPCLGGRPLLDAMPEDANKVCADRIGYIQHIDAEALSECAEELGAEIWLAGLPGRFVNPAEPLLGVSGAVLGDETTSRLRKAFTVESARSFEQDPRFGLLVLSEIASRALSPSVNDPGTAIDVLGRLVRVLSNWHRPTNREPAYPRLHVPPVRSADMLEDAFQPIARDGASLVEVQVRLQKALAALAAIVPDEFSDAASAMSAEALERACAALESDVDKASVVAAAILSRPS